MRLAGSSPEIPLPAGPRRVRRQRLLCLGFLPLLALPLLLVSGPFAPVDHAAPVALRSVPGAASHTSTTVATAPAAVPALRRATTTTTEPAPEPSTTTSVAPEARSAGVPQAAPATT
ncbi:MAG: hypothetical protein KF703_18330, partial [Actinobacteria bacterium]|nr:hypothetical protein [Actinomycetota bacterium]